MAFAFDPSTKLVDLYVGGQWKCKLAYQIAYNDQNQGHTTYWTLVGPRFDYHDRPSPAEVAQLQFKKYPKTVEDNLKRIDI